MRFENYINLLNFCSIGFIVYENTGKKNLDAVNIPNVEVVALFQNVLRLIFIHLYFIYSYSLVDGEYFKPVIPHSIL